MILQYQQLGPGTSFSAASECDVIFVAAHVKDAVASMLFSKAAYIAVVVEDTQTAYSATLQDCTHEVFGAYTSKVCACLALRPPSSEEPVRRAVLPDVVELERNKYYFDGNVIQCELVRDAPAASHRPYTRWYVNTNHVATLVVSDDSAVMVYLAEASRIDRSLLRVALDELTDAFSHDLDKWTTWEHKEENTTARNASFAI